MLRLFFASLLLSVATPLTAELSNSSRSIHGTGETLAAGTYELGIGSVAYGLTDDWLIAVPTLSLIVGYGRAEARHKFTLTPALRVSPFTFVETFHRLGAGSYVGFDFGSGSAHSITLGAAVISDRRPVVDENGDARIERRMLPQWSLEYDWYNAGNLWYVGVDRYILYLGHTWAWSSVHTGLITSPRSGFLPLPYICWRF